MRVSDNKNTTHKACGAFRPILPDKQQASNDTTNAPGYRHVAGDLNRGPYTMTFTIVNTLDGQKRYICIEQHSSLRYVVHKVGEVRYAVQDTHDKDKILPFDD